MKERRYIGPEVDAWSLGVLLYTMCTGLFPWDGDTLAEVMRNGLKAIQLQNKIQPDLYPSFFLQIAVRAKYVVPEYLSNDCKNIIARLLEPDPQKRGTSMKRS